MYNLVQKEKNSIESIYRIYEHLFQWGNEKSTYKIHRQYPIYENKLHPKSYLCYMLMGEEMAAMQLRRNSSKGVVINNKRVPWNKACTLSLPDWRRHYIEYTALEKYLYELPAREHTILGVLIASERINAFRNFGWKIGLYLRQTPKNYERKIRDFYKEASQRIWNQCCPDINCQDYLKIS